MTPHIEHHAGRDGDANIGQCDCCGRDGQELTKLVAFGMDTSACAKCRGEDEAKPKSPGQIAYEAELAERPRYLTGAKRPPWSEMKQKHRDAWERNALDAQLRAQGVIR